MNLPMITGIVLSTLIGGGAISEAVKDNEIYSYFKENKLFENVSNTYSEGVFVDGTNKLYFNELHNSEIVESSWNYNEVKTITMNLDVSHLDPNSKYIEINLPLGMEMVTNPNSLVDNKIITKCDSSQFNKVEIPNSSNSYVHKPKMGKIKLYLDSSVKKVSLDILVSVDDTLWSAVEGALAHSLNEKAITIGFGDVNTINYYKLDKVKIIGKDWTTYNHAETPAMAMNNTEIKTDWLSAIGYIQSSQKRYHKRVYMRMEIPNYSYIENGISKTKYATINSVELDYGGTYEIIDNHMIFKWENIYEHGLHAKAFYQFDGELPSSRDEVDAKFKFGELYIEDYFTGEIHSLGSSLTRNIKLISNTKERVEINPNSRYVFNGMYHERENVNSVLGGFSFWNYGAISNEKHIEIDFPYGKDSSFGVTKMVLPFTREKSNYNVEISIWNNVTGEEQTKILSLSNSENRDSYNLKLLDILESFGISENQNDWYFKNVRYTLGNLPSSWGFRSSWTHTDTGTIHGKYLGGNSEGITNIKLSSMDKNGVSKEEKNIKIKSLPTSNGTATGAVTSFDFYNEYGQKITELMAGEDAVFKGVIEASNYGYNNSNYLPEPVLYLRLPKGMVINERKTVFKLENSVLNGNLDFEVKTPRELNDGSFLYEISFNRKDFGIGYYSNTYSSLGRITFDIYVDIAKSLKTTSINARDTLFLVDNKVSVVGGGWWDSYLVKDKFDLNNNGSTSDDIATSRYDIYMNINSNTSWLEVDSSSEGSTSSGDKDYQPIVNTDDIIKYKLLVNNTNDGKVKSGNMEYYIPVPKKDVLYNEYVLEKGEQFNFDMILTSAINPIDGYEIFYSYNAIDFESYSDNIDLNKVAMIKIVNKKDIFPGDTIEFSVAMKYLDGSWDGSENNNSWSIFGHQIYEKNGLETSYLHVLDKFKVELIFEPKIIKNPSNVSINVGENAHFTTEVDVGIPVATGNWQYRTSSTGSWIDLNETSTTLSSDNVTYAMNGYEYRYVVSNKGATVESLPAVLTVADTTAPEITLREFKDGDVYKIEVSVIDNGSGVSHIILPDGTRIDSDNYIIAVETNVNYTFKAYDLAGNEVVKSTMIGELKPKSVSSNLDIYIKSENMISVSLDTNNIIFNDFSGVADVEQPNAINMTINSSLPYQINAYLATEIQNNDKSKAMDKSILNIKANSEATYNTFNDTVSPITLLDDQNSGNNISHGIDLKLKGNIAHKKDVYKTIIKFEVKQK